MSATIAAVNSKVLDYLEDLESEVIALRALSGLFNAHHDNNAVNVSELCYLVDPIIEREKAIIDAMHELFKTVGFKAKAAE